MIFEKFNLKIIKKKFLIIKKNLFIKKSYKSKIFCFF